MQYSHDFNITLDESEYMALEEALKAYAANSNQPNDLNHPALRILRRLKDPNDYEGCCISWGS